MAEYSQPSVKSGTNVVTIHDPPRKDTSDKATAAATRASGSTKRNRKDRLTENDLDDVVTQLGYSDCERLYGELDGLSSDDVSRIKKGTDTEVDIEKEAANVFKAWITSKGNKATRQGVLTALSKCGNNLAKQNLTTFWKKGTGKCLEGDIRDIIEEGELGPNDITNLFESLGLKQAFIDRKRNVERSNVQRQAKLVLQGWIKVKLPTIGDTLDAIEEADNKNASEELQEIWGITSDVVTIHDPPREDTSDKAAAATSTSGSKKRTRKDRLTENDLDDVVTQLSYSDCERLYGELDGLSSDDVSRIKRGTDTEVDIEKEAANVFKAWITSKGNAATRQGVLTALSKCGNNLAKQNLTTFWKKGTGKCLEGDITDVIKEGELGPNDITDLFESLGLKQAFIDRKRNVERSNVQRQAKLVLHGWIKVKVPTIGDILDAIEEADNKNASEELQETWGITSDPKFPGPGNKLGGN